MNRRQTSKLETRRLILKAARKLFLEKEVEKCTMRRIAQEAGVSPASIVVHFANKSALLEATLGEDIERTTDQAIDSMPPKGDLTDKLVHIWRAMYTFYDQNRNLYRTLISSTVFEPEEKTPFLTTHTEYFLGFVQDLIRAEKKSGRIYQKVDEEILANALFSLYFGTLIMFYRDPLMTPDKAADLVAAMTYQVLFGLMVKPKIGRVKQ